MTRFGPHTLVALLLVVAGCFPLIRDEGPPEKLATALDDLFEADEEIMVIPVWERTPFWKTDTSGGDSLLIEEYLFLSASDLHSLSELIDHKTTTMVIIGAGAAMGRGIKFQGYLMVSETGTVAWLQSYGTSTWHGSPKVAKLGPEWLAELQAVLPELREFPHERSDLWATLPRSQVELNVDEEDRSKALAFLTAIAPNKTTPAIDSWHHTPSPSAPPSTESSQ